MSPKGPIPKHEERRAAPSTSAPKPRENEGSSGSEASRPWGYDPGVQPRGAEVPAPEPGGEAGHRTPAWTPPSPAAPRPGRSIGSLLTELIHTVLARVPDPIVIGLLIAAMVILGVGFLLFVIFKFGIESGTP